MGGSTIRTSDTHLDALTLQSSCYGGVIPLCFGVCQVAVNLLWYNGFKSVPHTTTSGGKGGGGVKQQNTTYSYVADVIMGIAGTVITSVPRVWVGKNLYSGGINGSQLPTVTEPYTVQASGAMTYTLLHGATFAGMQSVTRVIQAQDGTTGVVVPLSQGADYVVEGGVLTIKNNSLRSQNLSVTYQYTTGSPSTGALSTLGLTLFKGNIGQTAWSGLSTYGTQNIAYSGISYVAATAYSLGNNAQVDNHVLEVVGPFAFALGSSQPDADPAAIMQELMTSARSGANFPPQCVDFTQWSNYCVANNLLISPCIAEQQAAADILGTAAELTNSAVVWSGNRLKVIPYGDTSASANGRTFTPNTTPVYDLDDTCWVDPGGMSDPITYELKTSADRFNHIRIEYLDRSQQYNVAIADARDLTDIRATGLRDMDTISAHWVCVMSVAQNMAQLMLQRKLYVNGTYKFTLPWHFILLEPMDLVTITDSILGLSKWPVRITSITEGDDGMIEVEAEDYPAGMASATLYPNQNPGGYQHDYNTPAGTAPAPVMFEGVAGKSITGLAVSVAVLPSTNPNWGGAQVWVSSDGTNYKQIGVVYGPARAGTLSANVAAGDTSIPVNNLATGTQLLSGSATDASSLNTLCYIGGANPEYFAYQTATLTGTQAYTLSGLNRGAYQTGSKAHSSGDPFVRVDTAVATIEDLDLSMIGKTIYVKLCSFNQYGGAQQGLADVSAYPYTITGYMAMLPPTSPVSLTASLEGFGVRLTTVLSPDLDIVRYEYRVGASWAAGTVVSTDGGASFLWAPQNVGSYTFWVAAVDAYGAYSAAVSSTIVVGAGTVSGLTNSVSGDSIGLTWAGVLGSFANYGYEIRYGTSFASGTSVGIYTVTSYVEKVRWTGSRIYWVAPIDVKGNYGTPVSVTVAINAPGPVSGQRADVVDNNVLLYWNAPSTGTLPVDHYEIRKGSTWAGGTVIGSNANSTFCGVFEQLAGTYTYWFAAVDTAGTYTGTPVSLSVAVTQPPDYILRANFNSAFGGTLSNMYLEAGQMIGPIDTTKTWTTHFTANSWTSPQDQINAGYPVYIEPSVSSGTYTEIYDYGTTLPAVLVTITPTTTVVAGSETLTCQIYTSPDNVTYTAMPAGFSALCTAFRYIKFVITMTGTPGANVMVINNINVKLNIKQRMDSGQGTSVVGGVTMTFGYPFIEADVPVVQAAGLDSHSKPYFCAVIYTGPPNPTNFSVRIYDSTGTEVSGVNFSWTARGY
jgi:hypothetical protein